ncbi:hypothetical protein D4F06_17525 [Salmonella enterica subsp. enterica serovar Muenchen]|nr:hypothetical protein [Salmonella enterica subsp. enterica serovar Muenchen]EBY3556100.1 hypothetical protein [Salmonella enterica subsp. enterica serovar Muenchen]ECJ4482626.1 hypothetical protein [Salmonella enterica subsp. diarizonae]
MGNTILVLTASGIFYINSNDAPYLIYIIATPILITISLTVFIWLAVIIHQYFQELVKHKYTLSFIMFFIWFLGIEVIIVFNMAIFIKGIPV